MKQQIHINDQGELLLIEAPEKPVNDSTFSFKTFMRMQEVYDEALTSAIEKGIRFRDQEATKWLLINEFNGKENMRGWFQPGKSFDLPNPYTAQVVEEIDPYVDPYGSWTRKVAVLIPLKQDKCNVCFDEWPETCPKCSKSGEPGNEVKKGEGKRFLKTPLELGAMNTDELITYIDKLHSALKDYQIAMDFVTKRNLKID